MSAPARRLIAPFLLAASLAHPAIGQVPGGGRDVVGTARDLYASARYDEALAVLNDSSTAVTDRKSIEQYRSLCLLALGRGSEAESAIAAVVTADPMFIPGEADASPRVRLAFSEVRQRLLPQIATARYSGAKAAYDRKDYTAAEAQFRNLLMLLDDPQRGGRRADLRRLASGFVDLSAAAAAPPPEPKKAEPPVVAAPPPPVATPREPHIWSAEEPGVAAPVAIRQDVPRVPSTISAQARERGLLEVVIDEQGRVVKIPLRLPV